MANINSVKIRMYRHGFGDCFLVRFYVGARVKYKMLIDCGLKHNDSVVGVSMEDVVADIKKEVSVKRSGKMVPHLDALVATHEHWDHVSGFKPERKLFDDFDIDNVWMAWTENPKDKVAQQINEHLTKSVTALGIAAARLAKTTAEKKKAGVYNATFDGRQMLSYREGFNAALSAMVDFYGPFNAAKVTPSGIEVKDNYKISVETQKAFDHIKTKLAKGKSAIRYCKPGTLIENQTDLPGVRIYVMGPPRNSLMNHDAPSKGPEKEVYFGLDSAHMAGFVKGVLKSAGANTGVDDGSPFDHVKSLDSAAAQKDPFYHATYFDKAGAWRTIEDDWLDMAGALALQMDNDTNNTSLVLAIELVNSGKVMLFPGDAQVGNWLSWHEHTWQVKKGSQVEKVNATDLLSRTVFYKTGHHGSHNATLKEKGLELMTNEDLVVFVPEKQEQYNNIPFEPLVNRLHERAKGRVLFSADANYPPDQVLANKPEGITKKDWDLFKGNIKVHEAYIEYTLQ